MEYTWKRFLIETWNGKTIGRIFFNKEVSKNNKYISGKVLDIGAGINPSYEKYLNKSTSSDYQKTDIKVGDNTIYLDANKKFGLKDETYDSVLLFNSIYIYEDVDFTLSEIARILKVGGNLLIASPFCMQEIPEPTDYQHFTSMGLKRVLKKNNFKIIKIVAMGDRGTAIMNLMHPFFLFGIVRLPFYLFGILLDKISCKYFFHHPAPMGYFVICQKK